MKTILLDANIIIYAAKDFALAPLIEGTSICYATITAIESLGFPSILGREISIIEDLLSQAFAIELDRPIIEKAISLRQIRRMSLGDAVVAATALVHDIELWTHNTKDFKHIPALKLFDPIK